MNCELLFDRIGKHSSGVLHCLRPTVTAVVASCANMILRLAGWQQCFLKRLGVVGDQGHCLGWAGNINAGVNTILWRGVKGQTNKHSVDTDEGQERTARLVITHSR